MRGLLDRVADLATRDRDVLALVVWRASTIPPSPSRSASPSAR